MSISKAFDLISLKRPDLDVQQKLNTSQDNVMKKKFIYIVFDNEAWLN